jgi:hypothetical protein
VTLVVLTAVVVGSSYNTTASGLIPALATTIEEDTIEDLANILEDEDTTEELREVLEEYSGAREYFFEVLEEFDADDDDDESVQALVDFINQEVS